MKAKVSKIIKNEIPILEYDPDERAVIMPDHEQIQIQLPEKAVFAFMGEVIDQYAKENKGQIVSYFESSTKKYPIYVVEYKEEKICLAQAPVGASAATQVMDWLIAYGVKKIITGGSCGVLREFEENVFLVPYKALRDEGTSYHYVAPSRFVDISSQGRRAIEETLKEQGLKYIEVITWTTDGFFRETKEKVRYRKEEGCSVVEMECSALAACAQLRGITWGELLYTADSLADVKNHDKRSWGKDSIDYTLRLCLEAVLKL